MAEDLHWYHITIGTYSSWLYGDPRGFRTRHHREHVEGDYKNLPPPGMYQDKERRSKDSLKQPSVIVPKALRPAVGTALREQLELLGAFVLVLSVSGMHMHILAKLPFGKGREWCGVAKMHTWHVLRKQHGWKEKLWGKRGKDLPVKDRAHQLNAYHYIKDHRKQGAWVWDWMEEQSKCK